MKILFVIADLSNGGAERVITNVANELASTGEDVNVLLFRSSPNDYPLHPAVKLNVLYDSYDEYKTQSKTAVMKKIRKQIRTIKPDVAVGFLQAGFALFASSLGMRFAKVGSIRNNPQLIDADTSMCSRFYRIWYRKATALVLQNNAQLEYFRKNHSSWKNTAVIGNPVSNAAVASRAVYRDQCTNAVMVGRLTEQKNYHMAVDAMKKVHASDPGIKLHIYGRGEDEDKIREYISSCGLDDCIVIHGWSDNIAGELPQYDLFFMSSDYEGMPNSLMEGMCVGLPCVSTDCPTGPAELIENNVSGILVPVGDSDSAAQAILKVASMSAAERKAMGEAARAKITGNFEVSVIANKWKALFEKIVNK